jgi:hypothetical protein
MSSITKRLAKADNSVAEIKALVDAAIALAREAAAAEDYSLLNDAIAAAHAGERKGGQLLLSQAAPERGVDGKRWRRRARLNDERFALALRRAQRWWRSRVGSSAPKAVPTREHVAPQARTVVSDWRVDELGHPTRFVVGICLARYRQMTAAGSDTKKIEAELIAEALERAAAVAASGNSPLQLEKT